MTKEQIIESILYVSRQLDFDVDTKYRTEKWHADVVVNCGAYKVAFNICKSPRNVKDVYEKMRKDRVCGCWLLMPTKNSVFFPDAMPCFKLVEKIDAIRVLLNSKYDQDHSEVLALDAFIQSFIKGDIKFVKEIIVKNIEICFFEKECWKCHKRSHIYFINRLLSSDGIPVLCDDVMTANREFEPEVVKAVGQYIKEHTELGIRIGEIKPRFSKTLGYAYPSFGCAFCDSIFGNHYVQDDIMEIMYLDLPKKQIELQEGMIVSANCWYRKG